MFAVLKYVTMEVRELRIGNLVNHNGKFKTIAEIGRKEVNEGVLYYLVFEGENSGHWLTHKGVDLIKPIPLTEEWLLKFGFKNNKLLSEHLEFEFYGVDNLAVRGMLGLVKPYSIKHVHQLQNLYFALTGEELTIK